jgi:hypothetical protein
MIDRLLGDCSIARFLANRFGDRAIVGCHAAPANHSIAARPMASSNRKISQSPNNQSIGHSINRQMS